MYLNTCEPGFGCHLAEDPSNPYAGDTVCAEYCDPQGAGGPSCSDDALTCVQINLFYGDLDFIDDRFGLCVDCCAYADVTVCENAASTCPSP